MLGAVVEEYTKDSKEEEGERTIELNPNQPLNSRVNENQNHLEIPSFRNTCLLTRSEGKSRS